jgi:hypothetical protein
MGVNCDGSKVKSQQAKNTFAVRRKEAQCKVPGGFKLKQKEHKKEKRDIDNIVDTICK